MERRRLLSHSVGVQLALALAQAPLTLNRIVQPETSRPPPPWPTSVGAPALGIDWAVPKVTGGRRRPGKRPNENRQQYRARLAKLGFYAE